MAKKINVQKKSYWKNSFFGNDIWKPHKIDGFSENTDEYKENKKNKTK